MTKIKLRHKQRAMDSDKEGYFKYEPRGRVPLGAPGRHGLYLPKNWVSSERPPAEIVVEGDGIDEHGGGTDR